MDLVYESLARLAGAGEVWVVGGALRDRLLGVDTNEVDLVTRSLPAGLSRLILKPGDHCFWLDRERQIMRITLANEFTIDLTHLQGDDIMADLGRRDFTINAMAMRLDDWLNKSTDIIDPLRGQQDLAERCLRIASPNALLVDPVRILRGIRLAISRNLAIESATIKAMQQAATQLPQEAAERIAAELSLCFIHPRATVAVELMQHTGVTPVLFPEVMAMHGVTQNKYHQFTVDEHSQKAFAAFVDIVHQGSYLPPRAQAWFVDYWSTLPAALQTAAMLAAWLHDIGKPPTRVIRKGRVTFYEHEQVGTSMARAIVHRLKLSRSQQKLIESFIRWHMYPMQLWRSKNFGPTLIYRFYRRGGQYAPLIVVFTLADYLAKGDNLAATETFLAHQRMVEDFLEAFFSRSQELISPEPLLDGRELISLSGKQPGPWLRIAKDALLEAQVAGELQSKADAIQWLRSWLHQEKNA